MKLATRKPPRRNETRELVKPILAALNAMPGVQVWRPHVLSGSARDIAGAGLAEGSADIVGIVGVPVIVPIDGGQAYPRDASGRYVIGRFVGLEVKWPGKRPSADQRLWLARVRLVGGFATVVHNVDEAVAAVHRCREGKSE